jgi:hypothetical protein
MSMRRLVAISVLLFSGAARSADFSSSHVVVVVEENHGFHAAYERGQMPFLRSLADKYGVALNYFANAHPSMGNYFMMTTGQIVSTSDFFSGTVTDDNLIRQIVAAHKTWKAYAEDLPFVGYTGGNYNAFVKRHYPMAYFDDVRNNLTQRKNLVPFLQFAEDVKKHNLPNFSFVVPNLDHDAHDRSLSLADTWLKNNIQLLLDDPDFQKDGILIITFDEAETGDKAHGGGHILTVVVGPNVKEGGQSSTLYQHQSLLATIEDALGLPRLGAAKDTPSMSALFK